jgi:hypothetical protein
MTRKIVQDKAAENRSFNDELQILGLFIQDKAPEYGLFALDKLQLPRQFIEDEAPEH